MLYMFVIVILSKQISIIYVLRIKWPNKSEYMKICKDKQVWRCLLIGKLNTVCKLCFLNRRQFASLLAETIDMYKKGEQLYVYGCNNSCFAFPVNIQQKNLQYSCKECVVSMEIIEAHYIKPNSQYYHRHKETSMQKLSVYASEQTTPNSYMCFSSLSLSY